MNPTWRAGARGTAVPRAPFLLAILLAILLAVAACATPAGGPGGSDPIGSGDGGAPEPQDRIHQQAHDALERWADAVRRSGGASITFVGELTGQIGEWEAAVGENNNSALYSGLVESAKPLSDNLPSRDKVKWLDGSTVDVGVLSAADTLEALVAGATDTCPDCEPLEVTEAQLATGLVETSRGPANAPIWVFSIAGSGVKVTRVAVDESVTVDPPPWNANNPPDGISIVSASGTADSKRVTLSFVGAVKGAAEPCGADYTAEAVESELAVVVIVVEDRNPTEAACRDVGKTRTVTLSLDQELGRRAILEVKQGLPVPLTAPS